MSKIEKLATYTAEIDFFSKSLRKVILKGQQVKAPVSLGSQWVKQNLASKNPTIKTTES